jgi:hypothetical protein
MYFLIGLDGSMQGTGEPRVRDDLSIATTAPCTVSPAGTRDGHSVAPSR